MSNQQEQSTEDQEQVLAHAPGPVTREEGRPSGRAALTLFEPEALREAISAFVDTIASAAEAIPQAFALADVADADQLYSVEAQDAVTHLCGHAEEFTERQAAMLASAAKVVIYIRRLDELFSRQLIPAVERRVPVPDADDIYDPLEEFQTAKARLISALKGDPACLEEPPAHLPPGVPEQDREQYEHSFGVTERWLRNQPEGVALAEAERAMIMQITAVQTSRARLDAAENRPVLSGCLLADHRDYTLRLDTLVMRYLEFSGRLAGAAMAHYKGDRQVSTAPPQKLFPRTLRLAYRRSARTEGEKTTRT
ncbi:hypothetical protein JOF53_006496 [Crossiella equi]|uniref:Uncharacterized protein n=1 Tax=Crossiella equi TaxID=130796 RepID=A0ABS5AN59_9PSEU|nr:hypothetical protein [Crossiella equi]MBP2477624.1 hypothetical protein [Crossiella equi]